jgi:hypothetical protein
MPRDLREDWTLKHKTPAPREEDYATMFEGLLEEQDQPTQAETTASNRDEGAGSSGSQKVVTAQVCEAAT